MALGAKQDRIRSRSLSAPITFGSSRSVWSSWADWSWQTPRWALNHCLLALRANGNIIRHARGSYHPVGHRNGCNPRTLSHAHGVPPAASFAG